MDEKIFIFFGSLIGFFGTLTGLIAGLLITYNLGSIINVLENLLGIKFLEVYFIDYFPSELQWMDVAWITGVSLILSLLATLYPAFRASRLSPAEALRYE